MKRFLTILNTLLNKRYEKQFYAKKKTNHNRMNDYNSLFTKIQKNQNYNRVLLKENNYNNSLVNTKRCIF